MTERLHQLLTDEADGLDVPAAPAGDILSRGKGVRRRRRLVTAAAAGATAAVVAGVAALTWGGGPTTAPDAADATTSDPVFSAGSTLFYGDGAKTAEIDDKAVKSIFYTSAGVLVRHGENPWSDGGGPQRFSLVTSDGAVHRLGLVTEETVHATDPDQPHVVYAEAVDGMLEVVVYDVIDDAEAARVEVARTKESWFWLTVDGDRVYVQAGADEETPATSYEVDWKAGRVVDSGPGILTTVAGGHTIAEDGKSPTAIDIATGATLFEFPEGAWATLSPDGSYAKYSVEDQQTFESGPTHVVDLTTGDSVEVGEGDWGWTPTGDVFKVGDDEVTTCSSQTGDCGTTAVDLPKLEHIDEGTSTSTMIEPLCEGFGDDFEAEMRCWNETDCSEPDAKCHEVEVMTDESWDEEIVLGGVIRES